MTVTRRDVPPQTRREWSRAVCRWICGSEVFTEAAHVVAYVPLGAEVDPHDAAAAVLATGRALYYPVSEVDPSLRRARTVGTSPAELHGEGDSLGFDAVSVLFLVPGVAFDETGGRLGRGRGWYDRVLCRYANASRWGLAFALQLVPLVPLDPWDVPMDAVVTERGWIDARRSLPLPEGTK